MANYTYASQQELEDLAQNAGYQGYLGDTEAMVSFLKSAELAANTTNTTPSADTLATLGGAAQQQAQQAEAQAKANAEQQALAEQAALSSQANLEASAQKAGYQGDLSDPAAMQGYLNSQTLSVEDYTGKYAEQQAAAQQQAQQAIDKAAAQQWAQQAAAEQKAVALANQQAEAQAKANAEQQALAEQAALSSQANLEASAVNAGGYQGGDYTDTAAMQGYLNSNGGVKDYTGIYAEQQAIAKAAAEQKAQQAIDDAAAQQWAQQATSQQPAVNYTYAPSSQQQLLDQALKAGYQGDYDDTGGMNSFLGSAALAAANATNTKVTADTLATLGGAGTVVNANNINTQGNEGDVTLTNVDTKPVDVLTTSPVTGLATSQISTLNTKPISTLNTKPISTLDTKPISTLDTKPISTLPTAGTQALTTADLASWGKTLPQGITADQLSSALAGQQTALSSQNANFLKDWNTSADALKTNILSGVDTKNQAFGTQATQGFMNAFKNFQIPTNQQTGVNLGNYNDNRNAAADQWWSQYVTGRR